MERNIQKSGLINLFVLLFVAAAGFAVARSANSLSGQVAAGFMALGVVIALVSWFQMRLEEQERLEKLEFDELARTGGSSSLFKTDDTETFPATRSREQFERFFVPGFTVLLLLAQGAGAWWFWRWLQRQPAPALQQPLVALGLYAIFFLALFLLGKYSAGVARLENQRLLRPGANYLLLGAYLCSIVALSIIGALADFPQVDHYAALALCALLALLAVENVLSLVLESYRPRVKGKPGLLLYDSRLVGLVSHPESLLTTAAHVLDYQFGFKVSETWFYRFLEKAFAWLVLAQFGILLLSTCFVFIEAGQQGLLERFGKPIAGREVIGPGFHFKYPWPIDQVYRYTNEAIQTFYIGFERGDKDQSEKTILWTVAHYKDEFNLLVASREPADASTNNIDAGKKIPPVNLLSISIPVQFQITNLSAWAYTHKDAATLLEEIGTREVVRYLVGVDLHELMSSGRFQAGQDLRERIQASSDEKGLGAQILFVGLQDAHPPVKVAASYEAVIGAQQKRLASKLNAEAFAVHTNALASIEAVNRRREAEADRWRLEASSLARAALFTNQVPAYRASPGVYATRAYLQTLTRGSASARKIVLAATNTQDVILLNLEEKLRADMLDLPLPTLQKKP
jgi:regulator of protease activity HflC (stomatin/prohibitin superfamily)